MSRFYYSAALAILALCLFSPQAFSGVYVIDREGSVLGHYLDGQRPSHSLTANQRVRYHIITEKSYRFVVAWANGERDYDGTEFRSFAQVERCWYGNSGITQGRYFVSDDCSGQPYAVTQYGGIVTSVENVPIASNTSLWFIPKDEKLEIITPGSWQSPSEPEISTEPNIVYGEKYLMGRIFPNDPEVTGVSSASFVLPISLEPSGAQSECIFKDGFSACGG